MVSCEYSSALLRISTWYVQQGSNQRIPLCKVHMRLPGYFADHAK